MLKILPIIFAVILSLSHIQFQKENSLQNVHFASAESESKVDDEVVTLIEPTQNKNFGAVNTVRLTWNPIAYAVRYRITYGDKVIISPTTGVEVTVKGADEVFKVTALDFDNQVAAEDVPIVSTEINTGVKIIADDIKNNPLIPKDIKVHGLMFHPRSGKLDLIINGYSESTAHD